MVVPKICDKARYLFYDHLWSFFRQLHEYLSQNWSSDGHFEMLNKSLLILIGSKVMREMQKKPKNAKNPKKEEIIAQITYFLQNQ